MQICFIHDLLRSGYGAGDADHNGRWLHALLAPILFDLGHGVDRLSEAELSTADVMTRILEDWGKGDDHAKWAQTFSHLNSLPSISSVYASLRQSDFIIGFELTPNQIRFLTYAGIPFLDVSIDSIRFAPDLFLRMRTNDDRMLRTLEAYDHTTAMLLPDVALLRSAVARSMVTGIQTSAILFVGQTDLDGSLICSAELASIDCFSEKIRRLMGARQQLLLKPHPYGRKHQSIRALREVFPAGTIVNDNIYALLNTPYIEHVVTLSSGVAQESKLFGKATTTLITPDNTHDSLGHDIVSRDYRIGLEALSPAFWSCLGSSVSVCRTRQTLVVQSGELRRSVGQSWGYVAAPRLSRRSLFHGQSLSFSADGNGLDLCTLGWSHPESSGIWSDGSLATMLVDTRGEPLELTLICAAFVPKESGPLQVEVCIGPTAISAHRFTFYGGRERLLVVRLPAMHGPVEVAFRISGSTRPKDAGLGEDVRNLGLRLIKGSVSRSQEQGRLSSTASRILQHINYRVRAVASILVAASGVG